MFVDRNSQCALPFGERYRETITGRLLRRRCTNSLEILKLNICPSFSEGRCLFVI